MALRWHLDQGTAPGNGQAELPTRLGPDQLGLARHRAGGLLLCSENPTDNQRCQGFLGLMRSRSGLWLPPMDFVWEQGSTLSPSATWPPRGRDPSLLPDLQTAAWGAGQAAPMSEEARATAGWSRGSQRGSACQERGWVSERGVSCSATMAGLKVQRR